MAILGSQIGYQGSDIMEFHFRESPPNSIPSEITSIDTLTEAYARSRWAIRTMATVSAKTMAYRPYEWLLNQTGQSAGARQQLRFGQDGYPRGYFGGATRQTGWQEHLRRLSSGTERGWGKSGGEIRAEHLATIAAMLGGRHALVSQGDGQHANDPGVSCEENQTTR